MALDQQCKKCFERNFERLLIRSPLRTDQVLEFSGFFKDLLKDGDHFINPEFQREMQRKLRDMNGISDPYGDEKEFSNQLALELYQDWKPKVLSSQDPFNMALRLALAGNVMDYAVNQQFDLQGTIDNAISTTFSIDHSYRLRQRIQTSSSILYLGDNAGEIVFDKLFIETIMHPYMTYVVRGGPAINDVTLEDSVYTGMDWVADVISSGYDAPSTIVSKSNSEFKTKFESADLIISKGQGNFEGLMAEMDSRIFYLMMVKCDLIAQKIGVPKGSFVVLNYGKN